MYTKEVKFELFSSNAINSGIVYINALTFNESYNDAVSYKFPYQVLNNELVVEYNAYGLVLLDFGTGCM